MKVLSVLSFGNPVHYFVEFFGIDGLEQVIYGTKSEGFHRKPIITGT